MKNQILYLLVHKHASHLDQNGALLYLLGYLNVYGAFPIHVWGSSSIFSRIEPSEAS
jgi:hypothetical protein